MSKKPFTFDFTNAEPPSIDVWGCVTFPIRLLGRAAIESAPSAQAQRLTTKVVTKYISRSASD